MVLETPLIVKDLSTDDIWFVLHLFLTLPYLKLKMCANLMTYQIVLASQYLITMGISVGIRLLMALHMLPAVILSRM